MPKPTLPPKRPILIASNSPTAGTGYGMQCAQLAKRLMARGHKVAIASNYGQEGSIGTWNGATILPRGFDMYSNDVVGAYHEMWTHENGGRDALVITLFDVWVYHGAPWDRIADVLAWVPIDHAPIPPKVLTFLNRDNVTPVAMSKFGAELMAGHGLEHEYAPHANEVIFHPTPSVTRNGNQITGRELMGLPATDDRFIVLTNAANKGVSPPRKSWDTNAMAMAIFMQKHEDVIWYIHSERDGAMGGVPLIPLLSAVGIDPDRVKFTEPFSYRMGLPQDALAAMYTAADVLLAPSLGEGFGVPTIESLACGTPTILSSWSASKELCGDGWMVEGQPMWDASQTAWWMVPTVQSTLDALEAAYEAPRGISAKAVEFAAQYDADRVFAEHWAPILDRHA